MSASTTSLQDPATAVHRRAADITHQLTNLLAVLEPLRIKCTYTVSDTELLYVEQELRYANRALQLCRQEMRCVHEAIGIVKEERARKMDMPRGIRGRGGVGLGMHMEMGFDDHRTNARMEGYGGNMGDRGMRRSGGVEMGGGARGWEWNDGGHGWYQY
ncbi:hypothetical protein EJ04DRAFT_528916 [Polyplosphaeria fusca]|uniref:Uncharacterized protein n=1 Tax=Polyplosphaeria fusca TaxID=682080 RepID=A0A9P4UWR2_9PLEO|nr:hypothetical protein EJ04DRAFT_528916 [Polyplosphaeria fusca]